MPRCADWGAADCATVRNRARRGGHRHRVGRAGDGICRCSGSGHRASSLRSFRTPAVRMPLDHFTPSRLQQRLRREIRGEVLFDAFSRGRYATDASIYQIEPLGVVVPKSREDAAAAIAIAREEGVPVLPRGGGTSQCGQTVARALVIDCSKYLDRVISVDVEGRRARVEPGVVLDRLNRLLRKDRLFFPVDPSTASRATIGGMTANNSCGSRSLRYGNMVHNVRGIDALLADGTQAWFGEVPGNFDGRRDARALSRAGEPHARPASARGRGDRAALPEGAAAGRRLQHRQHRRQRPQHGAAARRLGGHARLLQRDRARIAADPGAPGARDLPFPELLRRDGLDPADRRAGAERGRTGRPHDDRAVARHRDVPPGGRPLRAGRAGGAAADRVLRRRPGGEPAAAQGARRIDGRSRLSRRRRRGDRARPSSRRSGRCARRASTS